MTELERFYFIINQSGIRKEFIESKRTQTIEYWINSYRVACKFRQFTRNKCTSTEHFIYLETVKQAQALGLLPAFPDNEETVNNENI